MKGELSPVESAMPFNTSQGELSYSSGDQHGISLFYYDFSMVLQDSYTVLPFSVASVPLDKRKAPNAVSDTGVLGQGQIAAGRGSQLRCVDLGIAVVWDLGEGRRGTCPE